MRGLGWLGLLVVVGGVSCGACTAVPAGGTVPFDVIPQRDDVAFALAIEGDTVVVDLHSVGGIGAVELVLTGSDWPDPLELRLHLAGLENLTLSYGATRVTAAVSSQGGGVLQTRTSPGAPETTITAGEPAWIPLEVVAVDGADMAVPLQSGFFAVRLPADFYAGDYPSVLVSWIDFYR